MEHAQHVGREVWVKRVERWSDSGLSAKEFAAELGINPRTLTYWKWRLGKDTRADTNGASAKPSSAAPRVDFVKVHVEPPPEPAEPFELVLGEDLRLRIPAAFDANGLRRLLEVVRP